jgi:hypothetical protein
VGRVVAENSSSPNCDGARPRRNVDRRTLPRQSDTNMALSIAQIVPNIVALAAIASSCAIAAPAANVEDRVTPRTVTGSMTDFPPLENWTAPQFFDAPNGIYSSMAPLQSSTKAARTLATFIPLPPCRLVDTRGLFNPVYAGGPFSLKEIRVYSAAGNCGIPSGSNRIVGVSVAVTTLPTSASGDIEVIRNGATLGGTVLMVIQAGEWNSATTVTGVDSSGQFQVQVRSIPSTDLAIDINGYYAQMDPSNTSDFFSILGNFNSDGGLFDVEENGSIGAAIRGVSAGGADVRLAQGSNAIDIANGGIRARGAGVNTTTFAFIHQASASNICTDAHFSRVENAQTFDGSGTPADLSGLLLFIQQVGAATTRPVSVVYQSGTACASGSAIGNGWFLYNGATTFAAGERFNVMVIRP